MLPRTSSRIAAQKGRKLKETKTLESKKETEEHTKNWIVTIQLKVETWKKLSEPDEDSDYDVDDEDIFYPQKLTETMKNILKSAFDYTYHILEISQDRKDKSLVKLKIKAKLHNDLLTSQQIAQDIQESILDASGDTWKEGDIIIKKTHDSYQELDFDLVDVTAA